VFDFLPVLLEDRKQRVLTVNTEATEVEKYDQKICCISIAVYVDGVIMSFLLSSDRVYIGLARSMTSSGTSTDYEWTYLGAATPYARSSESIDFCFVIILHQPN
jgi:hypothetical protein